MRKHNGWELSQPHLSTEIVSRGTSGIPNVLKLLQAIFDQIFVKNSYIS